MGREIKFRAWDLEERRVWLDVHKLYDSIEPGCDSFGALLTKRLADEDECSLAARNRFEVMQFTGLLDKNGREIYEGDIIHHAAYSPMGIFGVNFGEYQDENGLRHTGWYLLNEIDEEPLVALDSSEIEIIGNVWENPELVDLQNEDYPS